jgi:hypothetical protein
VSLSPESPAVGFDDWLAWRVVVSRGSLHMSAKRKRKFRGSVGESTAFECLKLFVGTASREL